MPLERHRKQTGPSAGGSRPLPADQLARLLAGSWRSPPAPAHPHPDELAVVSPLLSRYGAEGLVWNRLRGPNSAQIRQLRNTYRQQILELANQEELILQVIADLRSFGIEPILIKGWAAARNYADPALRPFSDIDLCVSPRQFEQAMQCFAERTEPSHLVDLHQGVPDLPDRSWDEVFLRSQLVPLGNAEVRILGAEDHLRLVCLHCMRHAGARPLWLCDIAAALELLPADFDWDYCLSGKRNRTAWMLAAIDLAVRLLGAKFSDASQKRRDVTPRWVERTVLDRWADGAPGEHGAAQRFSEASLNFFQRLDPEDLNPIRAAQCLGLSPQTRLPLPLIQMAVFLSRSVPRGFRLLKRRWQGRVSGNFSIHRGRRFLGGILDPISESRLRRISRCKDAA